MVSAAVSDVCLGWCWGAWGGGLVAGHRVRLAGWFGDLHRVVPERGGAAFALLGGSGAVAEKNGTLKGSESTAVCPK